MSRTPGFERISRKHPSLSFAPLASRAGMSRVMSLTDIQTRIPFLSLVLKAGGRGGIWSPLRRAILSSHSSRTI